MLDRISNPEKFIDAEKAGSAWISEQRKEYKGLEEVVRSFFSSKSTNYQPFANLLFKFGGIYVAGASSNYGRFVENTDNPLYVGGTLLYMGLFGVGTSVMATRDSMKRRKIERERKLQRVTP